MMIHAFYKKMKSPVGELTLVANEKSLLAILWKNDSPDRVNFQNLKKNPDHPVLKATALQLNEYFAGTRKTFDLPVEFEKGTAFQRKVWKALQRIPYGKTLSYEELAQQVGSPRACRAVGAANGKNPISIIFPCHRVIGKSGDLTGFAGGLQIKRYLLDFEKDSQASKQKNSKK